MGLYPNRTGSFGPLVPNPGLFAVLPESAGNDVRDLDVKSLSPGNTSGMCVLGAGSASDWSDCSTFRLVFVDFGAVTWAFSLPVRFFRIVFSVASIGVAEVLLSSGWTGFQAMAGTYTEPIQM